MERQPIGVFDSGLGGLTALRALARLMPEEDLIYFGDTGRVPYGGRSPETIIKYALQDIAFLSKFHPKAVVVACGTVSTTAMDVLQREYDLPIFGVVEPAVQAAAELTRNGRVGLIGTQATIRSGAYERALHSLRPEVEVTAEGCPLLVPLVENGRYRAGDPVAELVTAEYMAPLKAAGVDTLILGCTHYPLLKGLFTRQLGPETALVDVGERCAQWVAAELEYRGLRNRKAGVGRRRYFVSDNSGGFAGLASLFLGEDVSGEVEQVDITLY